jgi:hypothetical protein
MKGQTLTYMEKTELDKNKKKVTTTENEKILATKNTRR